MAFFQQSSMIDLGDANRDDALAGRAVDLAQALRAAFVVLRFERIDHDLVATRDGESLRRLRLGVAHR
jgi:hypothetical protein